MILPNYYFLKKEKKKEVYLPSRYKKQNIKQVCTLIGNLIQSIIVS